MWDGICEVFTSNCKVIQVHTCTWECECKVSFNFSPRSLLLANIFPFIYKCIDHCRCKHPFVKQMKLYVFKTRTLSLLQQGMRYDELIQ